MADFILSFIAEALQSIIIWLILLPLSLIFATPIILIISFFGKGNYMENLKGNYSKLIKWWKNYLGSGKIFSK